MAVQDCDSQSKEPCTLSSADYAAIMNKDDGYINQKGAQFYTMCNYADAVQYYHIAAAMGNCDAISNLGYCYLYGRDMEQNTSLALAYFRMAASRGTLMRSINWEIFTQEIPGLPKTQSCPRTIILRL